MLKYSFHLPHESIMIKWLCMSKKQKFDTLLHKIRKLPLKITIPATVLIFFSIFYVLVFGIEKRVVFDYAGPACTRQLTLLPFLHSVPDNSEFIARAADKISVGGVTLASFSMCFMPKSAPVPGDTVKVSTAPLGGLIARKTYRLQIEEPVKAYIDRLTRPIPASKPLTVALSGPDRVFSYKLVMGDQRADCESLEEGVSCAVNKLELVQGRTYSAKLERSFRGEDTSVIAKKTIAILPATKVVASSIKAGETVYAKPQGLQVSFDKKIKKAKATLYQIEGEKRTKVATASKLADTSLQIDFKKELTRRVAYQVVLDGVEAADGSSLEQAYKLDFMTSGGPKVTGVSVGRVSVPLGSTVVVTFDQPLSDTQDTGKLVTLGGGAVLTGKQDNQLFLSLKNVPKCGDFSIKLANDIQSRYDIAGDSGWSFAGRMICHTIGTIGYSHQGRAINAYYFGNGSRTVLFTGAIHGNEWSTKSLMDRWIDDLEANPRKIPTDKQIVVVPAINPDGVAAGTRTNARNVDLNRNFATSDWRTDITDVNNRPFPSGGGPSPMSEPETNAIASLAQRLHPVLVVSYHSVGGVVAGNQAGASGTLASAYARLSGYRDVTGQSSTTFEYGISGTADDWYAQRLGVASLLVELGSHTYHQFGRNQSAMWTMVNG